MCSGMVLLYGIAHVVIAENHTLMGDEALLQARGDHVTVLDDPECKASMETFIARHPDIWAEDIGQLHHH